MFEFISMIIMLVFMGTLFFCASLAILCYSLSEIFRFFRIDPFKKFRE